MERLIFGNMVLAEKLAKVGGTSADPLRLCLPCLPCLDLVVNSSWTTSLTPGTADQPTQVDLGRSTDQPIANFPPYWSPNAFPTGVR